MNPSRTKFNPHRFPIEKKAAEINRKEKNLERAVVIGSVLIMLLVAVVFYRKLAVIGRPADGPANFEIQTPIHY